MRGLLLAAAGAVALVLPAASPLSAQGARGAVGSSSDSATAATGRPLTLDSIAASVSLRSLGPAVMSGRIADVAVPDGPAARARGRLGKIMYVASATGGLWKTVNAGTTYEPVFDREGSISIGDVAVAPSNPDVVYVGTGEANNMRSSSWGDGVYRSDNGGRTWRHVGLERSQHIGRIVVHPTDPDVAWVAAVGPLWADGGERGLYRTTDGGDSWTAVKTISAHTGFTDVVLDPTNPDVLYASSLQRQRTAYSYVGGGPESGIWKSTDGGTTWARLAEGLPTSDMGRIGLSVSASQPRTVYAVIEGSEGGVYRSDDHGASWRRTSRTSSIPWFFGQIRVDPNDPERVYHLGVALQLSEDGGRTFRAIARQVHADQHALWIDPSDSDHLVLGNDGGLYTSHDGGDSWDFATNLPVSQFYAIGVDFREPHYFVYGGLQDNNSWGGPSQTRTRAGITNSDWFRVTGGDGFYAAIDPTNPNIVYAESQNGSIVRFDVATGERKTIKPVPRPDEPAYRWNWSSPILISPHDPATIYFGANHLLRSPDRGDSWVRLGGDLTRQLDRDSLPVMGRLWPRNAVARHEGVADYGNISTIDESPLVAGLLYVGTDDGLVQVSRDAGATWTRVERFPGVPERTYVSRVVASRHAEGTVYAAFDGHRSNDFRPYLLRSTDYGRSWSPIAADLPASGPVYVLREDVRNPRLLFVGTEFGLYTSFDGGAAWSRLGRELPTVPVHDIVVHPREHDLIVGTHGRGIYILDDLTPLERIADVRAAAAPALFPVRAATLFNLADGATGGPRGAGALADRSFAAPNPPFGATLSYYLPATLRPGAAGTQLSLTILDSAGGRVRDLEVERGAGLHRVTWDLRLNPPYSAPATAGGGGDGGFGGGPQGAFVLPGRYVAELRLARTGGAPLVLREQIVVRQDPLVALSAAEMIALHAARVEATRMQATVQAVVRSAEQLRAQLGEAGVAVRSAHAADTLVRRVGAVGAEVDALLRVVRGAPRGAPAAEEGEGDGAGGSRPSIQQRVNGVAQQIGNVSSLPTRIQRETLDGAMAELAEQVTRLNALAVERVPALFRALDAAEVPWSLGRPVPGIAAPRAAVPAGSGRGG